MVLYQSMVYFLCFIVGRSTLLSDRGETLLLGENAVCEVDHSIVFYSCILLAGYWHYCRGLS